MTQTAAHLPTRTFQIPTLCTKNPRGWILDLDLDTDLVLDLVLDLDLDVDLDVDLEVDVDVYLVLDLEWLCSALWVRAHLVETKSPLLYLAYFVNKRKLTANECATSA
jgi:hypothetical protein